MENYLGVGLGEASTEEWAKSRMGDSKENNIGDFSTNSRKVRQRRRYTTIYSVKAMLNLMFTT